MTLDQALDILIGVHTDDDPEVGFRILMGAAPGPFSACSHADYIQAWRVVREHNHFRTESGHYPGETYARTG
jgi:hypothetical protein